MTVCKAIQAGGRTQRRRSRSRSRRATTCPSELVNQQVDNGQEERAVGDPDAGGDHQDATSTTVVKGGDVKASDLCKGAYASACKSAGIA